MNSPTAFMLLAVFAAFCTAVPLPYNLTQTRAGISQPEVFARGPFNIGELSHLNSISASLVEPDRDHGLAVRALQSVSGDGSAARHALANLESRFRLPLALQNNLRLQAHPHLDSIIDNFSDGPPGLSARDPFNIGELSHLNSISASLLKPNRDASLALRDLPSGGGGGGGTAGETIKHAHVKRVSGFRLPSALDKSLLLGAGSAESVHPKGPTAEAVKPDQARRQNDGLTFRELQSLSGAGLAGETVRHAIDQRASSLRFPLI